MHFSNLEGMSVNTIIYIVDSLTFVGWKPAHAKHIAAPSSVFISGETVY